MQFTVRNISPEIDRAARELAEREGVSLNQTLLRALRCGLGVEVKPAKKRELPPSFDGDPLEPEVVEALKAQRQVDPRDWE